MKKKVTNDVAWVIMTEPIPAMINTANLEVFIPMDDPIKDMYENPSITIRDGITYYSLSWAINGAQKHIKYCNDDDCVKQFSSLCDMYECLQERIINAITM